MMPKHSFCRVSILGAKGWKWKRIRHIVDIHNSSTLGTQVNQVNQTARKRCQSRNNEEQFQQILRALNFRKYSESASDLLCNASWSHLSSHASCQASANIAKNSDSTTTTTTTITHQASTTKKKTTVLGQAALNMNPPEKHHCPARFVGKLAAIRQLKVTKQTKETCGYRTTNLTRVCKNAPPTITTLRQEWNEWVWRTNWLIFIVFSMYAPSLHRLHTGKTLDAIQSCHFILIFLRPRPQHFNVNGCEGKTAQGIWQRAHREWFVFSGVGFL